MPDPEIQEANVARGPNLPGRSANEEIPPEVEEDLVEEDLLVEDVSIDGMCGVY